ncbi:MFS transporter [Synechocystis sp. PCC 7509]|uniref:MFS transporter n=1 Tax=Synechocystis sp. PCC 7509 TaxID=927677 RepID=UPI0002ABFF9A|nr:MFS transporter [Synechocystis sp. PCC 7509]
METITQPVLEPQENVTSSSVLLPDSQNQIYSKQAIRTTLQASTIDGVFAAIFTSITGGVLLTNFLLQVGASPIEIGMLSSIPMLLNLLQPLGAYIGDRTNSRHYYCLWIFGIARLLWLILVVGIGWISWSGSNLHQLVSWTLGMVLATHILESLGGSAWLSWMAVLVPHRLRGRYFGFRNSAASLTNLVGVPLLGFAVSAWPTGTIDGYALVLFLAVVAGIISLGCQFFMTDVNPQLTAKQPVQKPEKFSLLGNFSPNFLIFLFYFGLWTFAVNLSSPFFNLYLLDNLHLDLYWATLYGSLTAGANLVMLILWGKIADKVGNRPLLLLVGVLAGVTPLFWLIAGTNNISLWVWLPLIHIFSGGTWAAIELCSSNIQMEVAPREHPSSYFAVAAAVAGLCGALGTTVGGFLSQIPFIGGLPGLFALSAGVRLFALLPLVYVTEPRSVRVTHLVSNWLNSKRRSPAQNITVTNTPK